MRIKKILTGVLLFITVFAFGQKEPEGYNPFIPANLDDPNKLGEVPVVEGSYHFYNIYGDVNYTELSTFVWYVENGELGVYDAASDTWTPATGPTAIGAGEYVEQLGVTNATQKNYSGIWVRWDDDVAGNFGYVAVYERSAGDCVFDQQISGFKHLILVPPEVWLLADVREECSDQVYSITAQFNELQTISYPYVLSYSYPGPDGVTIEKDTSIVATDLDADMAMHWDLNQVAELNNTVDEEYIITFSVLRDQFGSFGKIAPLGATQGQYASTSITIMHLPQTGNMNMN